MSSGEFVPEVLFRYNTDVSEVLPCRVKPKTPGKRVERTLKMSGRKRGDGGWSVSDLR